MREPEIRGTVEPRTGLTRALGKIRNFINKYETSLRPAIESEDVERVMPLVEEIFEDYEGLETVYNGSFPSKLLFNTYRMAVAQFLPFLQLSISGAREYLRDGAARSHLLYTVDTRINMIDIGTLGVSEVHLPSKSKV